MIGSRKKIFVILRKEDEFKRRECAEEVGYLIKIKLNGINVVKYIVGSKELEIEYFRDGWYIRYNLV